MTTPRRRTTEPANSHLDDVDIDLDRVVVDPEYRQRVIAQLRRNTIDQRFKIDQQRRRDRR